MIKKIIKYITGLFVRDITADKALGTFNKVAKKIDKVDAKLTKAYVKEEDKVTRAYDAMQAAIKHNQQVVQQVCCKQDIIHVERARLNKAREAIKAITG